MKRISKYDVSDAYLNRLIKGEADIAQKYGAYGCSTEKIDCRCNTFSETEGISEAKTIDDLVQLFAEAYDWSYPINLAFSANQ